jgi:uncharacterized repeat protein (TIGR03803 family)
VGLRYKKEENPMLHRIRLVTLGAALIIMATTLIWASGAAARSYKIIHYFTLAKNPQGNLIFDKAGNLYGTASEGPGSTTCGGVGCGIVWKLAPNSGGSWTYSILHVFEGSDGDRPLAGLVFDAGGNLYGTTFQGGASTVCPLGCGVVFKLAPNPDGTWTESVLYSFTGGADGSSPQAGLIFDAAGNLYGTTVGGGDWDNCGSGCGVVFKLAPNPDGTWTYSVLYSFTGADGGGPVAGLIFDAAGNLYGTADVGGNIRDCIVGCGVVFKLAPNPDGTWTESVLYSFTGGADGRFVKAGLIFDAAGNLYGTTAFGGDMQDCGGGCGVVFMLAPNPDGTWTYSVLYSFTGGADGGGPVAGLIFGAAGNLYGTSSAGGNIRDCNVGCGVVFKLVPTSIGWSEKVLHSFTGVGLYPQAPVIFDPAGNLYGTTGFGTNNSGLVFKITP